MKVIYKLPQFLVLAVLGWIGFVIYPYIKLAGTTDFFEIIKYENKISVPTETLFGMDSYLVLMMTGLFFAIVIAVLRRNIVDVKFGIAVLIAILFFLQAYFGAKILFGLEQMINEKSWSAFSLDGQSLYGTVPMTLVFIPLLSKVLKKETKEMLDYIAPLWLTLLIFVRTGCFITGCCGADSCIVAGIEMIIPVQLIEVALDLTTLQIIFNIERENIENGSDKMKGRLFMATIGLYGIYRFFLEFIRNTEIVFLGMTYGQIYSIICIVIAIISIIAAKKKRKFPEITVS